MKVGVAYVGRHVFRRIKEELGWTTDKQLWVFSKIIMMLFKKLSLGMLVPNSRD